MGSELQLQAYQKKVREQNLKASREARLVPGVVGEANGRDEPTYWARVRVLCAAHKIPVPIAEHRFSEARRWRFDLAWMKQRIAVEIEGGLFVNGRHTQGAGMVKDMEKYNAATLMGWRVLRYAPTQLDRAIADVTELIGAE